MHQNGFDSPRQIYEQINGGEIDATNIKSGMRDTIHMRTNEEIVKNEPKSLFVFLFLSVSLSFLLCLAEYLVDLSSFPTIDVLSISASHIPPCPKAQA